jgi:TetR/AcrR family transcriptional repressor of uid operon
MSPGNLYRYFPSKEALIAGISERERGLVRRLPCR